MSEDIRRVLEAYDGMIDASAQQRLWTAIDALRKHLPEQGE